SAASSCRTNQLPPFDDLRPVAAIAKQSEDGRPEAPSLETRRMAPFRRSIERLVVLGSGLASSSAEGAYRLKSIILRHVSFVKSVLQVVRKPFECALGAFGAFLYVSAATCKSIAETLMRITFCWLAMLTIGAIIAWCVVSTSLCASAVNTIPAFLRKSFEGTKALRRKSPRKVPVDLPS
ncbi:MAG: hypothetical protein ACTS6A_01580, partial [Candidatus Hodgkinia cicadicola]